MAKVLTPRATRRQPPRLASIDLNLLVALDALLDTRSVGGAARRIGRSQPAMSHALAKLRDLMADPLLVRRGGVSELTERALRLAPEVRDIIAALETTLLDQRAFDARRSTRTFRI